MAQAVDQQKCRRKHIITAVGLLSSSLVQYRPFFFFSRRVFQRVGEGIIISAVQLGTDTAATGHNCKNSAGW